MLYSYSSALKSLLFAQLQIGNLLPSKYFQWTFILFALQQGAQLSESYGSTLQPLGPNLVYQELFFPVCCSGNGLASCSPSAETSATAAINKSASKTLIRVNFAVENILLINSSERNGYFLFFKYFRWRMFFTNSTSNALRETRRAQREGCCAPHDVASAFASHMVLILESFFQQALLFLAF